MKVMGASAGAFVATFGVKVLLHAIGTNANVYDFQIDASYAADPSTCPSGCADWAM